MNTGNFEDALRAYWKVRDGDAVADTPEFRIDGNKAGEGAIEEFIETKEPCRKIRIYLSLEGTNSEAKRDTDRADVIEAIDELVKCAGSRNSSTKGGYVQRDGIKYDFDVLKRYDGC